ISSSARVISCSRLDSNESSREPTARRFWARSSSMREISLTSCALAQRRGVLEVLRRVLDGARALLDFLLQVLRLRRQHLDRLAAAGEGFHRLLELAHLARGLLDAERDARERARDLLRR